MSSGNISYIYDATRVKLEKVVTEGVNITRTKYAANFIYEKIGTAADVLKFFNTSEGYIEPNGSTGYNYVYQYKDHLGNIRLSYKDISLTSTPRLQLVEENNYYPFGLKHKGYNNLQNGRDHNFGFGNKEEQDELGLSWIDITTRNYDPALGRWMNVDPLADEFPHMSPYAAFNNNPIFWTDSTGMAPAPLDWIEKSNGDIKWDENVTSANDKDLQTGDKYLGKNVLVGTHNRDAGLNEPINTAKFDLYLESNKEGPSATIMGNTVPADNKTAGTLAEGLYPARAQGRAGYLAKGKEDLAIIINEGKSVPTAPGSPKSSMSEIFFHSGNYGKTSLFYTKPDGSIGAVSKGCQTSGCGHGSRPLHNEFMKAGGTDFKGSYYLRSQPKLEVPKSK